jgi:hypothetical protein
MGKSVYIVLVMIDSTVEVDSVWWNKVKAKKRKSDIDENSDGAALIIDKWVNPKILLNSKEYTQSRITKEKFLDSPLIFDNRVLKLLN